MPVDTQQYKQILAQWASGVTVITTLNNEKWKGTTASSFSSVSLNPPLILVCIDRKLLTHQLLEQSGVFAVNILNEGQAELGKLFAGMYPDVEDRFAGLDCFTAETGCPIIPTSVGWLDCRIRNMYDGGDHTIFVGEVLAGGTPYTAEPLLYHNRRWGQFKPLT